MCVPGQHARPAAAPRNAGESLAALRDALGYLAAADPTALTAAEQADLLRGLERAESARIAARSTVLAAFDTARRWFAAGRLPVPARRVGGVILVGEPASPERPGLTAVYARVSSAGQEADLDRQVARVTAWAAGEGLAVGRVVTEVGSALDGKRRKFLALLRDQAVSAIVVEHRDRFARFGAEYVEAALAAQGRRLLVVDPSEVDDDLVRDVTEILTSLCARLYGSRAAAVRAARAVKTITGEAR